MAEGMPVEDDRFTTQTSHSYRTTLFTHWQKQTLRPQQNNQLLDRQEGRSPECTNITQPCSACVCDYRSQSAPKR